MQDPTNINKKHTYRKIKQTIKKAVLTAFTAAAITFAAGQTAAANTEDLTAVFHVYVDKQYVGVVSDRKVIESLVDAKVKEAESAYKDVKLSVSSEITYVPEQVFHAHSETDNLEMAKEAINHIQVQADASALMIDGKPVAYVHDEELAKEVIQKLKLKYVSENELKTLEAQATSEKNNLPSLKENESRILDVKLSKEVSVSSGEISPDQILSVDDAVNLLQKGSLEEVKYKVKSGDVLGSIAHDHNLKTSELLAINPGLTENSVLQIDQELNVTVLKPYLHVIVEKEMLAKEVIPFENEVVENASMFKGDTKVQQEGKDGERTAIYQLTVQNGQVVSKKMISEEITVQPVKHIVMKGTKVVPSRGEGRFAWPAVGGYVSSQVGHRWGRMHKGIDIARPANRTIKAADNGVVVSAGYQGGFGNKIVIDHQNGYTTIYAHLASISVTPGQVVSRGSQIGVMGSTGDSTGVHLHFELYKNGALQNPLNYIGK